jgi:tetratricopeptide (TPR) repeat protein
MDKSRFQKKLEDRVEFEKQHLNPFNNQKSKELARFKKLSVFPSKYGELQYNKLYKSAIASSVRESLLYYLSSNTVVGKIEIPIVVNPNITEQIRKLMRLYDSGGATIEEIATLVLLYRRSELHTKKIDLWQPIWQELISTDSDQGVIPFLKGMEFYFNGREQKALKYFNQAIKLKWENGDLYNVMGAIHNRGGRILSAKKYFLKAIEVEPNYATAWYNLGAVIRKEHPEKSERHFLRSYWLDYAYGKPYLALAQFGSFPSKYYDGGNADDAGDKCNYEKNGIIGRDDDFGLMLLIILTIVVEPSNPDLHILIPRLYLSNKVIDNLIGLKSSYRKKIFKKLKKIWILYSPANMEFEELFLKRDELYMDLRFLAQEIVLKM